MTTTLMWEARAAEGRGAVLLDWVLQHALPDLTDSVAGLERAEVFTADDDRVLVVTWWSAAPGAAQEPEQRALPELPDPPAGLLRREPHRWRFRRVESYP
ncbi:hypothetical protein LO771_05815 [Streptacidiphilus sp. ASG 303]|uniref:hypothetical protein n=1 Tax=Streptacidiphilus sp. ASG 303 TaxID=2896847 RepID=UPI001E3F6D94|nr:hypothetical protein [Streptacidiphilus sp. ASG 303]MCD0481942.1 hypothetical protein [Streptacidiphilus sp. ASG 303]